MRGLIEREMRFLLGPPSWIGWLAVHTYGVSGFTNIAEERYLRIFSNKMV
jgi:hypothetical protein